MMPPVAFLGERECGHDVRTANVIAVKAIANILRSSLGPLGLDKLLVDDIGDVTITNDGSTILKNLEIVHPAAKILVDLSNLQDKEVGDGTTSVVLIAADLLHRGNELVKNDIHPSSVIAGYKLALKECVKYIQDNLAVKVDSIGRKALNNLSRSTLSSKFISVEHEHFSDMIVDAITSVKLTNSLGDTKYPVSAVNILKTHGKSSKESVLVKGYAMKISRSAQGMPSHIENAKIAFLDFSLRQYRMQLGVSFMIDDPNELEKIRQKEKDVTKERITKIINAGANVILSTQGIDDMSLKYFVSQNCIAVRRVDKKDLHRIAKLTNGSVCLTLSTFDGEEKFDPTNLGTCLSVYEDRVGDDSYLFFDGCVNSKAATLILRGANSHLLDELERSVHDALCSVSKALESNFIVAGGAATEMALSVYLQDFAKTLGSREQLAIAEFAESLLIIPKTLSVNSARDSTEIIAKLSHFHSKAQYPHSEDDKDYKWYGIDLTDGTIGNNIKRGIIEAMVNKVKAIKFATEVAVSILRIDDLIKLNPEPENPRDQQEN